jgi:hypothetical protein
MPHDTVLFRKSWSLLVIATVTSLVTSGVVFFFSDLDEFQKTNDAAMITTVVFADISRHWKVYLSPSRQEGLRPRFTTTDGENSPWSSPSHRGACSHHDNVILFNTKHEMAGLNDRTSVMMSLSNLAGYLCAKLVVPTPYQWLDPVHNHDARVKESLTWKDNFFTLRLKESPGENQSAIIEEPSSHFTYPSGKEPGYHVRLSRSPTEVVTLFDQLENYTLHQQRELYAAKQKNESQQLVRNYPLFEWDLGKFNFYEFRGPLCERFTKLEDMDAARKPTIPLFSCPTRAKYGHAGHVYAILEPSQETQNVLNTILQEVFSSHNYVGYLHIRRGDKMLQCDTTLPKMKYYLECTLQPLLLQLGRHQINNFTFGFCSDEEDVTYRKGIQDIIENTLGMTFVDLDDAVRRHFPEADNYRRFQVIKLFEHEAVLVLEKHRPTCKDCDENAAKEALQKLKQQGHTQNP